MCHPRTDTQRSECCYKQERMSDFQNMFKDCPDYGIPPYFDASSNWGSLFNCHCDKIIEGWSKKWHPPENIFKYETTFLMANWNALTTQKQQKHTLTRQRMRKRRLHVWEVSAPASPTAGAVKDSWKKMVENGELPLGVPCIPFTLTQYSITNGQLDKSQLSQAVNFLLLSSERNF